VKVDEGLGLVTCTVQSGAASVLDEPPGDTDLALPIPDGAVAGLVSRELGLRGMSAEKAVATVQRFFRDRFRYSLSRAAPEPDVSAMEDFLRRTRVGHCEYFATGTVLLLRAAGIPARYAVGYSVQEWSPIEGRWVIRARHAHSWALVWVGGVWRDLDTTPPGWAELEADSASRWQSLTDLFAWAGHAFDRWRYGERRTGVAGWIGWLLIPLTFILVWRLFFRRRERRAAAARRGLEPVRGRAGLDSEFYAVEARLAELGLGRRPAEPATAWLERVGDLPPVSSSREALAALVALHYRHRFDPAGLPDAERARLRAAAGAWLAANPDREEAQPSSASPGRGGRA
jgi:protein-glutamine gamma-glutamyltransferase